MIDYLVVLLWTVGSDTNLNEGVSMIYSSGTFLNTYCVLRTVLDTKNKHARKHTQIPAPVDLQFEEPDNELKMK